ncbi:DNA-binding LytR/AlgR family response regulator [Aequitasia blattaphilus]|uniref:LytTR family transcriptional regulator n=1 Tax=Aequitasia blattaphilus TaxID=2949332 RepID=A0ABT1ECH1_9FIRM|nr:LytTR family DNA-binding domain-containing protein [Aequitasia blattaphilus]MCP1103543.1 LytTR family transcriptional regulator [Aequitasia blattaphilus]MCR8616183.1 LytTR family transcriptional regulator [Aequitasia blattaphilus]
MKIRIDIDETRTEEEIIIRGKSFDEKLMRMQKMIANLYEKDEKIVLYKGDTTYYIPVGDILFFETEGASIYAHTIAEVYHTKYRLYELEGLLSGDFMRVSKATILNLAKVYSVTKTLTSSGTAEFKGTHKQTYISRYYFKALQQRLEEMRR